MRSFSIAGLLSTLTALGVLYAYLNPTAMEPLKDQALEGVQVAVTEAELTMIAKQLKLEAMHGRLPNERQFGRFLRSELRAKRKDPSRDVWGSPYRLRIRRDVLVISSSGPDKLAWTQDDLSVTVKRPARGELLVMVSSPGRSRVISDVHLSSRRQYTEPILFNRCPESNQHISRRS